MKRTVRVIDVGGNGCRRADVVGNEVIDLIKTGMGEITSVEQLVPFACAHMPKNSLGVTYAVARNISNGLITRSPQMPWLDNVNLAILTAREGVKDALIVNDMDGAVAGMAAMLPNEKYFMGITWSSGIGMRIWRDGKILSSCEGGHAPLDLSPFAPLCGCGLRGCVESICGGEAIRRRVINETEILGIKIPEGIHPCKFLDQDLVKSIPWAQDIYGLIAFGMGAFLASIQTQLRLPLVVWKGTFARAFLNRAEDAIRFHMRKRLMDPDWGAEMKFIYSPDPEKDALIGAATLFRQTYK